MIPKSQESQLIPEILPFPRSKATNLYVCLACSYWDFVYLIGNLS